MLATQRSLTTAQLGRNSFEEIRIPADAGDLSAGDLVDCLWLER